MEDKNILLENLYNKIQINSDSKNISSHWKEYNKISLINKFNNQYIMHSYGIAQFSEKTFSIVFKIFWGREEKIFDEISSSSRNFFFGGRDGGVGGNICDEQKT